MHSKLLHRKAVIFYESLGEKKKKKRISMLKLQFNPYYPASVLPPRSKAYIPQSVIIHTNRATLKPAYNQSDIRPSVFSAL